jgi:hypothetical protein
LLFNFKIPKGQPMVELLKVFSQCCIRWMPQRLHDLKFCNCFSECFEILVVVVNFHMCFAHNPTFWMSLLMWISINWTQWKRHILSLLCNDHEGFLDGPKTIWTSFQFAWTLSTMNPWIVASQIHMLSQPLHNNTFWVLQLTFMTITNRKWPFFDWCLWLYFSRKRQIQLKSF